jgi:hypothetical protein
MKWTSFNIWPRRARARLGQTTPIVEKIRHDLNNRYTLLDQDKLTRFMMARAANKDLEIIDCRGKRISAGLGCVFEGQLRDIFWGFIKPCIEEAIQATCDEVEKVLPSYTRADRHATLQSTGAALQGFAERIYHRMVDLDRRMRGKGYPQSVPPYDPSRKVQEARELIAHKIAVLKGHYLRPVLPAFLSSHWTWIIGTILTVLGLLKSCLG